MGDLQCFHCHEPVATGERFTLHIDGNRQFFCCAGCQAVADTIINNGLADYYRFRTEAAAKVTALPDELANQLANFDQPDVLADISRQHGD